MKEIGKVYLVGAGPGDEGLLTIKGRALLEQAQVVVYDRLVGEGVMSLIPHEAKRIDVGKQVGNHPVPQEEINQILVEEAKKGADVIRLKGGDGFLFGRGGEELECLVQNGVPFEVVPGITSALAVPAYAGIPVTHRDYGSSVHIITGHKKKDGALRLDYEALVRLNGTLVFLMSVANAGEIARGLICGGMPERMPCAVIENGTRPNQRKLLATLSTVEAAMKEKEIQSPAIFLVGEVCTLSDRLDWFDRLPLKGLRVLVTSPKRNADRLASGLKALGAQVTKLPAIQSRRLACSIPALDAYTMLVFTSAAGVEFFFDALLGQGKDARSLSGKRVAAVGKETAKALLAYGILADFVPTEYSGEALANELLAHQVVSKEDTLLLLRAQTASQELTDVLRENGISFDELALYETVLEDCGTIDPLDYDLVTFTSASCVEGFVQAVDTRRKLSGLRVLCIGKQTAQAAEQYGMQASLPQEATIAAMINWIGGMKYDASRTQAAQ